MASAHQLDAELRQVGRADAVPRRARLLARRGQRLAGDEDALTPVVGEWVVERQPCALDARNAAQALLEIAVEGGEALPLDSRRRSADRHEHASLSREADVLTLEIAQTAAQHRRAGNQDD